MARTGKIARLPADIRNSLNLRLDDGEPGKDLVEWLNSLAPVQEILARDFGHHPVSERNLSEWRQGGFLDWQRQQTLQGGIETFFKSSEILDDSDVTSGINTRLSAFIAAQLAAHLHQILAEISDPLVRFGLIRDAARSLHTLRISDRTAARAERETYEWEASLEKSDFAANEQERNSRLDEEKRRALSPVYDVIHRNDLAKIMGGTPEAMMVAEYIVNISRAARGEENLPPIEPSAHVTKSDLVQPNPTSAFDSPAAPLSAAPEDLL